jgi:hypothetical protein
VALLAINGRAVEVTTGDLVSAVLRHAVMAHDMPLSGAGGASDGTG